MACEHRNITKKVSVEVFPAYRVLQLEGRLQGRSCDYEIALVNIHTREIAYYVDVAHLYGDLGSKPMIHFLAYRSPDASHSSALEGFASSVLFDLLVPNHTVILADGNHWAGGPFLWQSKVSQAIQYGRKTYFIEDHGSLRRLATHEAHQALTDELWSKDAGDQPNLAAISRQELSGHVDTTYLRRQLEWRMNVQTERLVLGQLLEPSLIPD